MVNGVDLILVVQFAKTCMSENLGTLPEEWIKFVFDDDN